MQDFQIAFISDIKLQEVENLIRVLESVTPAHILISEVKIPNPVFQYIIEELTVTLRKGISAVGRTTKYLIGEITSCIDDAFLQILLR